MFPFGHSRFRPIQSQKNKHSYPDDNGNVCKAEDSGTQTAHADVHEINDCPVVRHSVGEVTDSPSDDQ